MAHQLMRQTKDNTAVPAIEKEQGTEPRYFSEQVIRAQRFFLDLNPATSSELTVVSGGCEHCKPDYKIARDGFQFLTIEFVARGAGRLCLNEQEFALTPGTTFVYGPQTPHSMQSEARNPLVKYFAVFTGDQCEELMEECQLALGRVIQVARLDQIEQVFEDLILHGRGDHPNRARMCTVALRYLLMKIGDVALPYGQATGRAFATYQQCRRHIEEHYLKLRSMQEVAEACRLDQAYLCRLFQRFGREHPGSYLRHLRLSRAAELLQNSGRSVKEVADELGFSDPFSFSRAFHHAFGLPPSRVRQIEGKVKK